VSNPKVERVFNLDNRRFYLCVGVRDDISSFLPPSFAAASTSSS